MGQHGKLMPWLLRRAVELRLEENRMRAASTRPCTVVEINVNLVLDYGQSHTLRNPNFGYRHIHRTFDVIFVLLPNSYDL